MYTISITVDAADAGAFLAGLQAGIAPERMKLVAGRAATNHTSRHLLALSGQRHRAVSPTDFYGEAAASTRYEIVDDGVMVGVHRTGIAQRFHGGDIEPVNARLLAIPARDEAIGRRPREFSNLEVIFFEHGGALVERESTDISTALDRRKGREGQRRVKRGAERGGGVLFWLVPKVHQDPDDAVLPAARTLLNVVFDDVAEYVDRVISRGEAA